MVILTNIEEQIEKGNVRFEKIGNSFCLIKKKFSTDSGEEIQPEITSIDIETLDKQISNSNKVIQECNKVKDILIGLK